MWLILWNYGVLFNLEKKVLLAHTTGQMNFEDIIQRRKSSTKWQTLHGSNQTSGTRESRTAVGRFADAEGEDWEGDLEHGDL